MIARILSTGLVLPLFAGVAHAGAPAGGAGSAGGLGLMSQLPLFIGMGLIFYFLLIRPQQQRAKKHAQMISQIKRGDTVVTQGGFVAKVTKVHDEELTVELAEGVRAKLVKGMVIDVRGKGQPVPANDQK